MASDLKLLLFRHGGAMWGIPTGTIAEVVNVVRLYPLPSPADNVAGLMVYRGETAAAITLTEPADRQYKYGIVTRAYGRYKVLLNNMPGVLSEVKAATLKPYEGDKHYIRSVAETGDESIYIIDPRRLVRYGL